MPDTLPTPVMSAEFGLILVKSVVVYRARRQRREVDTADLEYSIRQRGVLVPIIVRREGDRTVLVAGERRLRACINLGFEYIPALFAEDLPPLEYEIIELEENIKRKDLPWQDRARATARIHELHVKKDSNWTKTDTANSIGTVNSVITTHLKVVEQLTDPKIAECKTMTEAVTMIDRSETRRRGSDISIFLRDPGEPEPVVEPMKYKGLSPEETILCGSFLEWAPNYDGEPFDFVHCDFPYGIGVADGPVGQGAEKEFYDDSEEAAFKLLECFVNHQSRFLALSSHVMFWYSDKLRDATLAYLREIPGMFWLPHPLIWVHAESGITPDYRRRPKHVYDTCLFGTRNRYIVKVVADCFSCPSDTTLHPSTKPEPMLEHFMGMLVDEHTNMLDPTCGSGSSVRAAEKLGAARVLGLDISSEYCIAARNKLRESRNLRTLTA